MPHCRRSNIFFVPKPSMKGDVIHCEQACVWRLCVCVGTRVCTCVCKCACVYLWSCSTTGPGLAWRKIVHGARGGLTPVRGARSPLPVALGPRAPTFHVRTAERWASARPTGGLAGRAARPWGQGSGARLQPQHRAVLSKAGWDLRAQPWVGDGRAGLPGS